MKVIRFQVKIAKVCRQDMMMMRHLLNFICEIHFLLIYIFK